MFGPKRLSCSFFGKTDVAKLVAGPKVYICDDCVVVASRIMTSEGADQPATHDSRRPAGPRGQQHVRPCHSLTNHTPRHDARHHGTARTAKARIMLNMEYA